MIQSYCPVLNREQVADNTYVLTFLSPEICREVQPGQFVNIKVDDRRDPLLRRPYSIYGTDADRVTIIFNVVGKGSTILHRKLPGETIDVLGPLGVPFSLGGDEFDMGVLVGGGLGVAPLPLSTRRLTQLRKSVVTFLGARTADQLVETLLENVHVATDDGTRGFRGTVVDLMQQKADLLKDARSKIFACGPTKMLQAVAAFARQYAIPCEVSLEGPMACGFGICQGCPVELVGNGKKYALMCKDGPTFDIRNIRI